MRKGLGKGKGIGYYNLPQTYAHDKRTHHLAGKGIKSAQPMPQLMKGTPVKSIFTGAKGQVASKEPFAVKYTSDGKTFVRFSNPKYWVKGGKSMVMVKFGNNYTMIPQKHLKDFQAQYGGRVCKGGKFSDDAKEFLTSSWDTIKSGAAQVGSGIKKLDPKTLAAGISSEAEKAAKYVSDIKQSEEKTKESLKTIFGTDKKEEHEKEMKEQQQKHEMSLVRPEIKKLDRQTNRVSALKEQIVDAEGTDRDASSLYEELEREEDELRDAQEKASNLSIEDMSNGELRTLAIRHKEGDGFFNVIFGSENEYEKELLRRITKERQINTEIYDAKHPKKSKVGVWG